MNYITIKQACVILGVSSQTIRRKIKLKKRCPFPSAIKPGHDWFISEDDVLREKEYMKSINYTYKPIKKVTRENI